MPKSDIIFEPGSTVIGHVRKEKITFTTGSTVVGQRPSPITSNKPLLEPARQPGHVGPISGIDTPSPAGQPHPIHLSTPAKPIYLPKTPSSTVRFTPSPGPGHHPSGPTPVHHTIFDPPKNPFRQTNYWTTLGRAPKRPSAATKSLKLTKAKPGKSEKPVISFEDMIDKAAEGFQVISNRHFPRANAPIFIQLPFDVFSQATDELRQKTSDHHEHVRLIGRNLEILWRQQGQSADSVRYDPPADIDAKGLAIVHLHPTQPGIHDGADLAFIEELNGPRMTAVIEPNSKWVSLVVRTQEFDDVRRWYKSEGKDLSEDIRSTYSIAHASRLNELTRNGSLLRAILGPRRMDESEARIAGTKAVCGKFGLVFYMGDLDGKLERIEPHGFGPW